MKHKHAELIKAWADGAQIQFRLWGGIEWLDTATPQWEVKYEYRIKPEEKQPVVRWQWVYELSSKNWHNHSGFFTEAEALNYFSKDVFFKLEYTRTEFPE
jgi:hypothetical protein